MKKISFFILVFLVVFFNFNFLQAMATTDQKFFSDNFLDRFQTLKRETKGEIKKFFICNKCFFFAKSEKEAIEHFNKPEECYKGANPKSKKKDLCVKKGYAKSIDSNKKILCNICDSNFIINEKNCGDHFLTYHQIKIDMPGNRENKFYAKDLLDGQELMVNMKPTAELAEYLIKKDIIEKYALYKHHFKCKSCNSCSRIATILTHLLRVHEINPNKTMPAKTIASEKDLPKNPGKAIPEKTITSQQNLTKKPNKKRKRAAMQEKDLQEDPELKRTKNLNNRFPKNTYFSSNCIAPKSAPNNIEVENSAPENIINSDGNCAVQKSSFQSDIDVNSMCDYQQNNNDSLQDNSGHNNFSSDFSNNNPNDFPSDCHNDFPGNSQDYYKDYSQENCQDNYQADSQANSQANSQENCPDDSSSNCFLGFFDQEDNLFHDNLLDCNLDNNNLDNNDFSSDKFEECELSQDSQDFNNFGNNFD